MNINKTLLLMTVALTLVISFSMWKLSRIVNYNLSYKTMVENTVRDLVKSECLNE